MKKGIFTICILALCVINLIFNIIIVFTMLPGIKNTNTLVTKITNLVDLDGNEVNTSDPGEVELDNLEGIDYETTVTLATTPDSSKFRYARVKVYVSLNKTYSQYESSKKTIEEKESIVISIIDEVISKYTADNVLNSKNEIRKEILAKLQEKFGASFVYDVSFSQFNVQ